jgi:transcriptional regulator with XRE-family HTH domain
LFFRSMCKAAGISRKELAYDLRVSRALVDMWFTGDRNDPLKQARNAVRVFLDKDRADLLPAILIYVAGGEEFDGVVLERIAQLIKGVAR